MEAMIIFPIFCRKKDTMFCKNCGFQLKDTAKFCPKCGTANTPPPIPPQPSNFAPQQNSSFSPNAQSIAVKTKKPLIPLIIVGIVILIVIIIAFCIGFTGFGGASGGSKGGYKKATEAAEAALTAEHTADAATMMKLLPAEGKEYWEDDKNLTEKQLQDYMQNRMNSYSRKYDEVSVKVDDNSNPIENSKVTERVNSNYLDKYGITADEVIYYAECGLTLDGEEHDEGNDVYVYKYNGRWYSIYPEYHLIEDTDSE